MLVAMVTAPGTPAWAMMKASCSWKRAFSTWCLTPCCFSAAASSSDFSMETVPTRIGWPRCWQRSEEHTSELQSLMRISYDVFCLKQKKRHNHPYKTDSTDI